MHDEELWIKKNPDSIQYIFDIPEPEAEFIEEVEPGLFAIGTATPPIDGLHKINIRKIFEQSGPEAFQHSGCAHQLLHWRNTHKFCGACGR